jgi:hypothetical protein
MKAILKTTAEKYNEMIELITDICKKHMSENSDSGKFYYREGYDIAYDDASNNGHYYFRPNEVRFEGTLVSFNMGGEYFIATESGILLNHKSDSPKWIKGEWTIIEHPRLEMGIWEIY